MTVLDRLDDLARRTGVPALNERPVRRRPLRWTATLALVASLTGFVLGLGPAHGLGTALLMTGFAIGNLVPIVGPLKPWGAWDGVDEFDRALRARAHLIALSVLAGVAVIGLWLLVLLSEERSWTVDALSRAASNLAFLLTAIATAGPTCVASWALRPVAED